jgi:hypothetical protein
LSHTVQLPLSENFTGNTPVANLQDLHGHDLDSSSNSLKRFRWTNLPSASEQLEDEGIRYNTPSKGKPCTCVVKKGPCRLHRKARRLDGGAVAMLEPLYKIPAIRVRTEIGSSVGLWVTCTFCTRGMSVPKNLRTLRATMLPRYMPL